MDAQSSSRPPPPPPPGSLMSCWLPLSLYYWGWNLIKLLLGLQGLMVWPTRNTAVTDLSKLRGICGLIITRGENAHRHRKALKSRIYHAKWIHYFDTLKWIWNFSDSFSSSGIKTHFWKASSKSTHFATHPFYFKPHLQDYVRAFKPTSHVGPQILWSGRVLENR